MSKNSAKRRRRYCYTQNRELSWLRFNQRVLEEADDETVPPLERLKFIAIFSRNLDEFFMVRVGSLFDVSRMSPAETDDKTGLTPAEQLRQIYEAVPGLMAQKKKTFAAVNAALSAYGMEDVSLEVRYTGDQKQIGQFYKQQVLPVLSPLIVGSHHPMLHLENKRLYIAALLRDKKGKFSLGVVPVPESLPPYWRLPDAPRRFVRTETLLLRWAPTLFGSFTVTESCVICITRNADICFDEDKFEDNTEDFRARVAKRLKKRDNLAVMRLELSQNISEAFCTRLMKLVQVEKRQVIVDACPLNMSYVFRLAEERTEQTLLYPPYTPRWPEDIHLTKSLIAQIKQRDKLLFFPFDAVSPFLTLLAEAAERPEVLSIKITIYRLASSSKIARMLCRAAENGKEVVVLMELRARFDEANNIAWSKVLEEAGCRVIYGIEGYKCHSKICLITLRQKGKLSYITQIGTGNYNEKTNALYTDLSLMTASKAIGEDATLFFQNMRIGNPAGEYVHLLVSPQGIKAALCARIDEQIQKGCAGYIGFKVNALTEREIIDKLAEASRAGVTIDLLVRGICCVLPGVPSCTETVHVTSIVGRFLEHARLYCFGRGTEALIYLSSADLMTRNMNRRVEIACPVYDRAIREKLQWIWQTQGKDTAKASILLSDGRYRRKSSLPFTERDSQREFMEVSCHKKIAPFTPSETGWQRFIFRIRQGLLNPFS